MHAPGEPPLITSGLWLWAAVLGGVIAVALWVRFGPTVFVTSLTSAWTCL